MGFVFIWFYIGLNQELLRMVICLSMLTAFVLSLRMKLRLYEHIAFWFDISFFFLRFLKISLQCFIRTNFFAVDVCQCHTTFLWLLHCLAFGLFFSLSLISIVWFWSSQTCRRAKFTVFCLLKNQNFDCDFLDLGKHCAKQKSVLDFVQGKIHFYSFFMLDGSLL